MGAFLKSFWAPMLVTAAASMAYCGRPPFGIAQHHAIYQLWTSLYWLTIAMWVIEDARCTGKTPCYDFGLFLSIAMPVTLLWYVVRSRGIKGILLLLLFFFLAGVPEMVALAFSSADIQ